MARWSALGEVLGGGGSRGRRFSGEMPLAQQAFTPSMVAVISEFRVNISDQIRKCPDAIEDMAGRRSQGIDGKL